MGVFHRAAASSSFVDHRKVKDFLRQKGLPVSGKKSELVCRVSNFIETDELETELREAAFKELEVEVPITFN